MLFKNFGNPKVAYSILNHGIPAILDLPLRTKALTKAMFQDMLEELMIWHASLSQSLVDRQAHPDMKHARRLSALNEHTWQMQRREEKRKAKDYGNKKRWIEIKMITKLKKRKCNNKNSEFCWNDIQFHFLKIWSILLSGEAFCIQECVAWHMYRCSCIASEENVCVFPRLRMQLSRTNAGTSIL